MYGIYANIGGILMGSMLPYIAAYMDPLLYPSFIAFIPESGCVSPHILGCCAKLQEKMDGAELWIPDGPRGGPLGRRETVHPGSTPGNYGGRTFLCPNHPRVIAIETHIKIIYHDEFKPRESSGRP